MCDGGEGIYAHKPSEGVRLPGGGITGRVSVRFLTTESSLHARHVF